MTDHKAESDYILTEAEIDDVYRRWRQKVNFTYALRGVDQIVRGHVARALEARLGSEHSARRGQPVTAPTEVLILRAMYALEMAQLQMQAERYEHAARNIEKGIELMKEALG